MKLEKKKVTLAVKQQIMLDKLRICESYANRNLRMRKTAGGETMQVQDLRTAIHNAGYSVGTLAETIGVDQSTLYRKLNGGKPRFTIDEAAKIKQALSMDDETACKIFLR